MWEILIFMIIAGIYIYLDHIYSYWPRNGFDHIKPIIPYGNLNSVRKRERSFGMAIYDLYLTTKQPIIGIYLFFRPALLIRDPELVKSCLTRNFNNFHDRGVFVDDNDPSSQNLFALEGQKWKSLRAKLTPTFTSGKLKNMFETITITGKSMQDYLDNLLPDNGDYKIIEMKDVLTRYAVDIIGSTIFGLNINSFNEPRNDFFTIREKLNNPGFMSNIRSAAIFLCPRLIKLMKLFRIPDRIGDEINKFMVNIVKQTIDYREKNNITRKDLMQSLIQLRNTGKISTNDDIWDVETAADNLKSMSIEQCAAQAFIFYIAGLETTASTTSFLLYELTQNEEILQKLKDDIQSTLDKHNGEITYDSIQDMKYLELCLKETLRKYPGLPILNRECTEDFIVPNLESVIKKGTAIIISTMGLHRDPKYFPEPLKFNPERFLDSENNSFNESCYLPFGDGPRNCIGVRLGKMNAKMGIVMLLTKFNIEAVEKKEMEFDNYSVGLIAKNGINIKMAKKID